MQCGQSRDESKVGGVVVLMLMMMMRRRWRWRQGTIALELLWRSAYWREAVVMMARCWGSRLGEIVVHACKWAGGMENRACCSHGFRWLMAAVDLKIGTSSGQYSAVVCVVYGIIHYYAVALVRSGPCRKEQPPPYLPCRPRLPTVRTAVIQNNLLPYLGSKYTTRLPAACLRICIYHSTCLPGARIHTRRRGT